MTDQPTLRPTDLAAIRKTERAYPHEIRAMVAEIDASRARGSDADAQRWQWLRTRMGTLQFECVGDAGKMRVTSIEQVIYGTPTDPVSLDEAVDRARAEKTSGA